MYVESISLPFSQFFLSRVQCTLLWLKLVVLHHLEALGLSATSGLK